ncbi:hypothetical protein F511_37408 [Dorcoceras hygrometricum]|uniref:Splicing factor 3B subunit 1-like n=1 Tax=Dorcoceras hygrometricum TaxID=472368 RepID=A0A2Z7CDD0_9LAMI|nr:hypothetical protein F511_37408 [Dorcoceras hygrometricum]
MESRIDVLDITNYDADMSFKVLSNEEGPLVETEKETENDATDKGKKVEKIIDSEDTEPLSKVLELIETSTSDEESMSIDDILMQIPEEMILPSVTAEEPTNILFGHGISFKEVNWYKASLPQIDADDKGKEPLVEEIKGNPAKEMFTLICADVDFLVQIREAIVEEISSLFYSFSLRSFSRGYRSLVEMQVQVSCTSYFLQEEAAAAEAFCGCVCAYSSSQSKIWILESLTPDMLLRAQIHDVRKEVQTQKAGRDDKKGEIESSRGPPSDDRSRPSGGGSSSEPSRKIGGSYKGRGSRSSGWNRWFS